MDIDKTATRKRWQQKYPENKYYIEFECPDCKSCYSFSNRDINKERNRYRFCPSCGIKLDPPEMLMWVFDENIMSINF